MTVPFYRAVAFGMTAECASQKCWYSEKVLARAESERSGYARLAAPEIARDEFSRGLGASRTKSLVLLNVKIIAWCDDFLKWF
jgi:hypothetical protein